MAALLEGSSPPAVASETQPGIPRFLTIPEAAALLRISLRYFRNLLEDPRVASLLDETQIVARRWSSAGPKADRASSA